MAAFTKESVGAYATGGSLSANIEEKVNIGTEQEPVDEIRYKIMISVSVEIAWSDDTSERQREAKRIYLSDPDDSTKDYRLELWDIPTIARALAQGLLDADTDIKINKGNGISPNHGTAITTIS
jgi:hypothetical protein